MSEGSDEKEDWDKAVQGMGMGDAVVLRMFKSLGISDDTMRQIEKELREKDKKPEDKKQL